MSREINISGNWLFFIFFHLTILKLLPGSMGNRIAGGILLIAVFCLVVWSVWNRWHHTALYPANYRMECLVGIFAVVMMLVTCIINFDWQQQNWPLSVIMMISALASYCFLIFSYWLFRLHLNEKGYVFVLFLFILINAVAIWEYFDFPSVKPLLDAALRSDSYKRGSISSLFPGTTGYGPWAAVAGIFFLLRFLHKMSAKTFGWLELACAAVCIAGALLAGSRTGLVGLGIGLVAVFFAVSSKRKIYIGVIGITAVIVIHVIAFNHSFVARKVGTFLPYFKHIQSPENISWPRDFVPVMDSDLMHSRILRWQTAIKLFKQHPFTGIGLGQYNIKSGYGWEQNAHNVFLNILAEGGVILFVSVFGFILLFALRKKNAILLIVLLVLGVMGIFEHPYDHSLPWNLTTAWMLAHADKVFSGVSG